MASVDRSENKIHGEVHGDLETAFLLGTVDLPLDWAVAS